MAYQPGSLCILCWPFRRTAVLLWGLRGRMFGPAARTRSVRATGASQKTKPEDKESRRWLDGCERASTVLAKARSITVIADRESDIYHLFANRPSNVELIVRAAQNRALEDGGLLFDALGATQQLQRLTIETSVCSRQACMNRAS